MSAGRGPEKSTPPPGPGRIRPVSAALISGAVVVGLILGWLIRPVWESTDHIVPLVGWRQPLVLAFMAALIGFTAWSTWRTVAEQKEPLPAHQGVNRLVLAKTCAVLGAFAAGAYAGHALSWIGIAPDLSSPRIIRPMVACLCAAAVCVAGLLLEQACRSRIDPDDPRRPTETHPA